MARWEPDSRDRLTQAAIELFEERGFEPTTVAEIAERAGLTKRTFFRHYADKREVLFAGSARLEAILVDAVAAAPADLAPLDAITTGLGAAEAFFDDDRRPHARKRQEMIEASADLRERELIKLASLADALAATLHQRGVAEPAATLAAEAGIAIFKTAFAGWLHDDRTFAAHARAALAELRAVTARA